MFLDATGIIIADDKRIHLSELSRPRALAALPFAGRYRLIDFVISNMVNSGITLIGVSTLAKYKSLLDHLGTGSAYDLDRKNQGLHILPPYLAAENYYNQADDLKGLLEFVHSTKNKNIIIAGSSVIFSSDFDMLDACHQASGADITVLYNHDGKTGSETDILLETDEEGKLIEVYTSPNNAHSDKNSLNVMVMAKELMVDILSEAISIGIPTISPELFLRKCKNLNIYTCEYTNPVLRITNIHDYYEASMRLLDPEINEALFWGANPVYTKVKDEAPAYFEPSADVENALVSDGCLVKGEVKDSVLFRGVTVGKSAKVDHSIIFQNVSIGRNVELKHVIIDKDAVIRDGTRLIGQAEYPVVIGKGAVV